MLSHINAFNVGEAVERPSAGASKMVPSHVLKGQVHRPLFAGLAAYDKEFALLRFGPIKSAGVDNVVRHMSAVAEWAIVDCRVDEVPVV